MFYNMGHRQPFLPDYIQPYFQIEVSDHCIQKPVQTPFPTPRRVPSVVRPSSGRKPEPVGLARELEPSGPPDRTYKVVFAGDAAVGKTSFINRLTKGDVYTREH
jgi:hypothetical protein